MDYSFEFSSPEKIVETVKSNDRIALSNLCSEPRIFPKLLMDRAQGLSNVRLFHMRPCGDFVRRYLAPGMEQHVKCSTAVFLRDKTVRERARAILEIAHPDFVNELLRDGRRLNLLS